MAWKNQYTRKFILRRDGIDFLLFLVCAANATASASFPCLLFPHQFVCAMPTVDGVNCISISCAFRFGYVGVDEPANAAQTMGKTEKLFPKKVHARREAQWLIQWLGVCECMLTNDIKLLARSFFVYFPARKKTTIVHRVPIVSANASSVTTEKKAKTFGRARHVKILFCDKCFPSGGRELNNRWQIARIYFYRNETAIAREAFFTDK